MVERVERRERERESGAGEEGRREVWSRGEERWFNAAITLRGKVAGELRWHGDSRGPRAYNRASWKTGG